MGYIRGLFVATRAPMCHLHAHGAMAHARMHMSVLVCVHACVCVCVRRADQMLCCSLQGALISSVFTVAGGQQCCSQACCWPNRDEWDRLERTTPPRWPANTPSTPLHMHSKNHTQHTNAPLSTNGKGYFITKCLIESNWNMLNYNYKTTKHRAMFHL